MHILSNVHVCISQFLLYVVHRPKNIHSINWSLILKHSKQLDLQFIFFILKTTFKKRITARTPQVPSFGLNAQSCAPAVRLIQVEFGNLIIY